jgi:hypothetical protein
MSPRTTLWIPVMKEAVEVKYTAGDVCCTNILWAQAQNNVSIKYYHNQTKYAHAEYQSLTGCLDWANIFDPMHFILVWNEWKLTCLIISLGSEDWNPHDSHKQAYTPAKYTSCLQFLKMYTFILYVLCISCTVRPFLWCLINALTTNVLHCLVE